MLKNYVELAINTESVISSIDNINYRLLHSSLGICTEIGELFNNEINLPMSPDKNILIGAEIGDIFWYIAVACDILELDFNEIITRNLNKPIVNIMANLVIRSSDLIDLFKKTIYYKKVFDTPTAIIIIEDIIGLLRILINNRSLDLETILEKNINKLTTRYPNKFTSYHAINRDLEAEHKTLC